MYKFKTFYGAVFLALFILQGCASLGYGDVDIDTTRKAIVVANAEIRAANLLLQDLIARRAISRDAASETLSNLQGAKDNLQTALNALDLAGDPVIAGNNLQRANVALSLAINLLAPLVEN